MKNDLNWPGIEVLSATLSHLDPAASASTWLDQLVGAGLDRLPLPGSGRTLERWQALAAVAERDLSLAKLYESHTDALAILAELGGIVDVSADDDDVTTWGVWAAEAPRGRATIERMAPDGSNRVVVDGAKCWCSGAASATHALLTAWEANAASPQLIALPIRQRGVAVDGDAWQAVGMAGSASLDVRFDRADGQSIGGVGDYLSRPGFWQGGGGVAACWYGGSLAIAAALRRSFSTGHAGAASPFRLAALGKVDVSLRQTAGVLREAARWIDENPRGDAGVVALRARLAAEQCATQVLGEVGRTLGAAPYCRDARFARMAADLPVFIRQSHAERDFASLAEKLLTSTDPWTL
jgi:alkylation response protein AidB-like acyl-CoA dehydrogenase